MFYNFFEKWQGGDIDDRMCLHFIIVPDVEDVVGIDGRVIKAGVEGGGAWNWTN